MVPSDDTALCALCGDDTGVDLAWAAAYPGLVCTACEARAVNADGEPPAHRLTEDDGDNPVFIDERKCWRKYREGGYVTMLDRFDCESLEAYIARARPEAEPEDDDEDPEDGDEGGRAGDVAETIGALRRALARSSAERELLASLEAGLARLRGLYRSDKSRFDDGDLAYLRGIARIMEALATFVAELDEPAPSRERLRSVQPILEPFVVGRRVSAELLRLGAPAPAAATLGEEPQPETPLCPHGHRMVVRRGLSGRYWECTRYPDCDATIPID